MKTRTLLVLLAALGVAAPTAASATQSRINAMGGGVKAWTIEDEVNVFDFPSLLVRFGNRTYIDNLSGGGDFPNGRFGFHYNLSDDTVIALFGAHINPGTRGSTNDSFFTPAGNAITGGQSVGVALEASQAAEANGGTSGAIGGTEFRYGLMFATVLGTSTRFGVGLNILMDNQDVEQPTGALVDQGGMVFDISLGLGVDFVGSELELTLGVELGFADDFRDAVNVVNGQQTELLEHFSSSHFGLRIGARWTFDFFNQTKIVAYTQFLFGTQEVENLNAVVPRPFGSYSGINWVLGADLRIEPFEDVVVSPGLGIRIAQASLEGTALVDRDSDLLMSLPFYGVGVDMRLTSWLDARFGASQTVNFHRDSDTNVSAQGVTNEVQFADVKTRFAIGVGLNIPVAESVFSIDLDVNPDFLINGPDFLTGTSTGDFGMTAAAKYAW